MESQIRQTELFITNACNLNCEYCINAKRKPAKDELSIEGWKRGIDNLERIGIKLVILIGGEPTLKKGIDELIRYINQKPEIDYAVSTNAVIKEQILQKLLDAGLKNVIVSVDGIYENLSEIKKQEKCGPSQFKSYHGVKLLKRLKKLGIKELMANYTVTKSNLHKTIETYHYLAKIGVWVNLCPYQWRKYQKWDKYSEKNNQSQEFPESFTENDREELQKVVDELIKIKKKPNNKIANSLAYLENFTDFAIIQNNKCSKPTVLGVIATGGIMYCPGQRTSFINKYNIADFTPDKFKQWLKEWKEEPTGSACPGCTFSFRDRINDFEEFGSDEAKKYPNIWHEYKIKLSRGEKYE